MELSSLGFTPSYACEVSPEFPGDGNWKCPVYRFADDAGVADKAERLGAPLVVRVRSADGSTWVGNFFGGLGGLTGVYACPSPLEVCVVYEGLGYLIEIASPAAYRVLPMHPVLTMERAGDRSLVIAAGYFDLLAIDDRGLLWVSDRVCLDDLAIRNIDKTAIHCTGTFLAAHEESFAVAIDSGRLVSGPLFKELRSKRGYWHRV